MKKITEDLEITGIIISMYGKLWGAEIELKFLDTYFAKAMYFENSNSNYWFETSGKASKIHESFSEEVEDNEDEITEWVDQQILSYRNAQS